MRTWRIGKRTLWYTVVTNASLTGFFFSKRVGHLVFDAHSQKTKHIYHSSCHVIIDVTIIAVIVPLKRVPQSLSSPMYTSISLSHNSTVADGRLMYTFPTVEHYKRIRTHFALTRNVSGRKFAFIRMKYFAIRPNRVSDSQILCPFKDCPAAVQIFFYPKDNLISLFFGKLSSD